MVDLKVEDPSYVWYSRFIKVCCSCITVCTCSSVCDHPLSLLERCYLIVSQVNISPLAPFITLIIAIVIWQEPVDIAGCAVTLNTEALMGTATARLSATLLVEGVIMMPCGKQQASGTGVGTLPAWCMCVYVWSQGTAIRVLGCWKGSSLLHKRRGKSHENLTRVSCCWEKKSCLFNDLFCCS